MSYPRLSCEHFRAVFGDKLKCCISCHSEGEEESLDRSELLKPEFEWVDGYWCCGASKMLHEHPGFTDERDALLAVIKAAS